MNPFDENSQIVQDTVFMIKEGLKKKEDVKDFFNLREVVERVLAKDESY